MNPEKIVTFPVEWRPLWKSLSLHMCLAVSITTVGVMAFRYLSLGSEKASEHLGPVAVLVVLAVINPLLVLFAFAMASWLRLAKIMVTPNEISGLNYWGRRKSIPLSDIVDTSWFANNGINAVIVHGRTAGKIYLSEYTRQLSPLLGLVNRCAAENNPDFERLDLTQLIKRQT